MQNVGKQRHWTKGAPPKVVTDDIALLDPPDNVDNRGNSSKSSFNSSSTPFSVAACTPSAVRKVISKNLLSLSFTVQTGINEVAEVAQKAEEVAVKIAVGPYDAITAGDNWGSGRVYFKLHIRAE